jgi:predicted transcriptional regulator of viral defense system
MRNPQHARQTQHGLPVAARVVRETIDRAIAVVAGRQHGLITTRQLLDLGLSMSAIEHRARVGRLHRLHRGVYAVGHRPVSPLAHALAAVLACGPGATLSHSSAGTLWGISKHWHPTLEVTTRCCRSRRGLRVHRSKTLTAQDITVHFGIPTTTPARTLLDNAPRLADSALARAVNDLRLAGYLSLVDLSELLDRHPDTHAAKRLRKLLARPERPPTRSEFEDAFLLFAERYALPEPQVNIHVAGHEADIFFPDHRLVVELDSYLYHSDREQFESDRDRDPDLLAAGIATVRLTWERLQTQARPGSRPPERDP